MSPLPFLALAACLLACVVQAQAASLITWRASGSERQALECRPAATPAPVVVYAHGLIVDLHGYEGAARRGFNLERICRSLAAEGYIAFAPIRRSGRGDIPAHQAEIMAALDHARSLPGADASRMALMGFSRGGLLALMAGVERSDLSALIVLAPAPGVGHFTQALQRVPALSAPVLLLVESSDEAVILENFAALEQTLRRHGKSVRAIRYDRGGGHRLFHDVSYWWQDVSAFLTTHLGTSAK